MEKLISNIGTDKNPTIIKVNEYKGRKFVDIRKYYYDKNEELQPTKKGVSLNSHQFSNLVIQLSQNNATIKEFLEDKSYFDNYQIQTEVTIGRDFNLKFENEQTTLVMNPKLVEGIGAERLDFFKKLILHFQTSLGEVLEDENEIDLVLDVFNRKLNKEL